MLSRKFLKPARPPTRPPTFFYASKHQLLTCCATKKQHYLLRLAKRSVADDLRLTRRISIERRSSIGATHVGRGGAANVATKAPEEAEAEAAAAKEKGGSSSEEHKKAHHHGLAEKAKGLFKKA